MDKPVQGIKMWVAFETEKSLNWHCFLCLCSKTDWYPPIANKQNANKIFSKIKLGQMDVNLMPKCTKSECKVREKKVELIKRLSTSADHSSIPKIDFKSQDVWM